MKRPAIFAVCAVVLFVLTAGAVRKYVQGLVPAQPVAETIHLAPVLVAAQDLAVGTTLGPEQMRVIRWPADAVPAGAFTEPSQLAGWVVRTPMVQNEPLLPDRVADSNARGVLPLLIPAGMRAASVRVNEVTGISGFVTPGSKVDIIVVMDSPQEGGKGAFTLLDDIEVLAVAQTMDHRETKPTVVNTVTVLVTPAQAERLSLAASEGTLQLALRNFQDSDPGHTPGITVAQLAPGAPPVELNITPVTEVEVIRGNERAVLRF
jgi:pilus assembly protein CpaB